jgi:anti-anti-sigma regulatory factor
MNGLLSHRTEYSYKGQSRMIASSSLADNLTNLNLQEPFYRAVLDVLPISIVMYEVVSPAEYRLVFMNLHAVGGQVADATVGIGKRLEETLPAATAAKLVRRFQDCLSSGLSHTVEDSYQLPDFLMWTTSTFIPMHNADGRITHTLAVWKDITDEKQREFAERQHKEEIIEQQTAALAELSTPLLTISDTTVVMPLVGTVDSRRVTQIMDSLLQGVATSRASIVILDITGVAIVDTQVANAFIRASQAVQLLGAQVVITGIRPEVAQTLVQLGVDLRSIITRGTLRDGITYALQQ